MRKVRAEEGPDCFQDVGARKFARFVCVLAAVLLSVGLAPAFAADPSAAADKKVLVLNSFSDRNFDILESLKSALRARDPRSIGFYAEYLEDQRFSNDGYETSLVENLRRAYGAERPDLVIVYAYPALQFALRHRDELFPGVPILFTGVGANRIEGQKMLPGVTGVTEIVDVRGTIDLALRLHPKTDTVAVITNTSEFEKFWLAAVHAELLRRQDRLREVDIVGPASGQLLKNVAALPPDTVVLFQLAPYDSIHSAIGVYDILAVVGQQVPTYCIFPALCLNHGGIGGADTDLKDEISLTAEQAKRVLSGERAENIPIVSERTDQIRVDSRQLRRWKIPESALPPGSQVLYREPTFWQREQKYIIVAVVVILAQSLLILGLLWQRARKRKAEAVLRESEKRFRVMADTTPSLIWMCDQQGKITYLNYRRIEFTGSNSGDGFGETWSAFVHPDDLKDVTDSLSAALKTRQSFSKEYRLRRHDGVYRWIFDVASPRVNGDRSFSGFISSGIDITDQKLAQEALENVSGQLIEAQEKERARIARDLHDDICQRLALLSMELEQVKRNGSPPATKKHLEDIRQHCSEIAGDVQSLSHELHSSKLEYLGIVSAISGFCKEFGKQHAADVEFAEQNVPPNLPKDVSLCLFRVVQEALNNAIKYSGTRQIAVTLSGADNEVQLVIKDAGAGFDVERAKQDRGLGLVSMQERVHLVHGYFDIQSRPGAGTKIVTVVPVTTASTGPQVPFDDNDRASAGAA